MYRILRWKRNVGTRLLGRWIGRWEVEFQRELISNSCEKSRCLDLTQSPVFWGAFVLAGMIFWGLMTQIWILSYIIIIIIIIIIYGKLKTVVAKIYGT